MDPITPPAVAPVAPETVLPALTTPEIQSTIPTTAAKPTVSAAKALGLPEAPSKTIKDDTAKYRKDHKLDPIPGKKTEEKKETSPASRTGEPASPIPPKKEEKAAKPEAAPAKPAAEAKPSPEVETLQKQIKTLTDQIAAITAPKPEAPKPVAAVDPEAQKRAEAEIRQGRLAFVETTAKSLEIPALTEAEMDEILEGGKPAVAKFEEIRRRDLAYAIMTTREGIYNELNPVLEQTFQRIQALQPALDEHMNWQRVRVEESFKTVYPYMVPHMALAKQVAASLMKQFPEQVSKLSQEDFFKELERQTIEVGKTLGVNISREQAAAIAAAPAAPEAPKPAVAAPVVPPVASPAPVVVPTPKPPAATVPAAVGQQKASSSFAKTVAASLTQ